eukprot:TRINITY_DN3027_c0_g1_i2.p3 TRINITY_DN3027_c0_g1~~TRINITY_DN3027_c0_g1_i2.p3  ORF type:complete len:124 (-),score=2.91 TRINITY_DN3027_c0_g1_i2:83-454(-)
MTICRRQKRQYKKSNEGQLQFGLLGHGKGLLDRGMFIVWDCGEILYQYLFYQLKVKISNYIYHQIYDRQAMRWNVSLVRVLLFQCVIECMEKCNMECRVVVLFNDVNFDECKWARQCYDDGVL